MCRHACLLLGRAYKGGAERIEEQCLGSHLETGVTCGNLWWGGGGRYSLGEGALNCFP